MQHALSKASAEQDVLFFVTTPRGGTGWFVERRGHSGRAYIDERGLHLVFGGIDIDFVDQYHGTKRQPNFDFGNREKASAATLNASGMAMPRNDWVSIPLAVINDSRHAITRTTRNPAAGKAEMADEQYYASQEMRLRRLKGLMDQDLITREEYERKRKSIIEEW